MSSCERCWADAGGDSSKYRALLTSRNGIDSPSCTPEQMAGPGGKECPRCHQRTLHQHTGQPMCGCPGPTERERIEMCGPDPVRNSDLGL